MREAFDKTQIQVLVLLTLVNRGLLGARAHGMLRDCPRVASPCSPSTP